MRKNFIWKIKLLLKSIRYFKNWYIIPLIYFNLIKKPRVEIKLRVGKDIILRTKSKSSDLDVLAEIFLEEAYTAPLGFKINKKDIIIDIGAHIGLFSIYASQFCKLGKIFCFEPLPENFEILQENVTKNKLENVYIENYAVSKNEKKLKFYQSTDDFAAGSILRKSDNFFEIESITLKQIFENNNIEKCNLLKMDCEGAEYEIFLNLPKEIFSRIEKICLEYHNFNSLSYSDKTLIDILETNGFDVVKIAQSENYGYIFSKHR